MPAPSGSRVGRRVAEVRRARRLTQDQLARAAGVSLSLLRKIEQGQRTATDDVLAALARALGVDGERLIEGTELTDGFVRASIPALRAVIDAYDVPEDGPVRPLHELRAAVADVVELRLASRYARLMGKLPALLSELSRAVYSWPEPDRSAAAGLLASAYRAADAVAYKHGLVDLSGRLVELMRWASAQANDDIHAATAAYVRTEIFFQSGNLAPGLRALEAALDAAPIPWNPPTTAARVALHMRAAVVAARMADAARAKSHLAAAKRIVARVPDGVYCGTAVGPASLRIHEVATAVELGDSAAVLDIASEWKPGLELPPERRSHFYIELAQAQLWSGRQGDAFESLQVARKIAPEHTRENPRVAKSLRTLLSLHRSSPETLLGFAEWARVV